MTSLAPRQPFALVVRVVIAALVVLVWWYAAKSQDPALSDATADWILVKAVSTDLSPFEDVRILAQELGVPYRSLAKTSEPVLHYRTSGGLLLLSPLMLVDGGKAHVVMGVVGMLCFLWILLVQTPRYCQTPIERLLVPLALASVSAAFIETIYWGAVSSIVGALMISTLIRAPNHSAGVPLAAATALKLYPGLLFVPLLVQRRIAVGVGLAVFAALTATGSALFDLSIANTARLLVQGSSIWLSGLGNVSLASLVGGTWAPSGIFLAAILVGILVITIYSRRRPLAQALALSIPISVLVSPISWASYDIALVPIVIWLWTRRGYPLGRYTAVLWLVFQAAASEISALGAIGAVRVAVVGMKVLVALAIAFAPAQLWEPVQRERELQPTMG